MDEFWHTVRGPVLEYGPRALGALVILVAGWLAVHYLVTPLGRLAVRSRFDPSVASFLVNSARIVLLVVVFLGVLQQLGIQTASLLTLLGTAGLAIALSLQGSLANFASGLLVLSFRMVRLGDLVEVGDARGRVAEMLPFHVVLVTADNQRITVPNTLLTNGAVRNHTTLPTRRAQWTLPVAPDADLAAVKEALRARLRADPRILQDPAPNVYVQEWTQDKRTLLVTAWTATADYQEVQQEMLEALVTTLEGLRRKG